MPFTNDTSWRKLSNSDWTRIYNDEYVSGYGDLLLVLDNACSKVVIQSNLSYSFETPNSDSCEWQTVDNMSRIDVPTTLDLNSDLLVLTGRDNYRVVFPVANSNDFNFDLQGQWPIFNDVNVPNRYHDRLRLCEGTDWLATPSNASLHVNHAFAKVRPYASKVQLGLPFLIIVIVANIVKVVCMFCTLRICYAGHIVTVGDAVATFLERPDPGTRGKCLQTQPQLLETSKEWRPHPWQPETRRTASIIGGKGLTMVNL